MSKVISAAAANSDKYADVKASLKAQLEAEGKKYPTNKNALSQDFIVMMFAPKLSKEDLVWLVSKRKECKADTKKNDNGEEVPVANWYPAFRSAVGKKFFPEFNAKKASSKSKKDENGDFLEELLKELEG